MNDTAVQNPDVDSDVSSTRPNSPGAYLESLREEEGLTQSQVAESLHLTVHYVNALEHDEYHKLPGKIFAKGYLKSYALLMNVAADPVVQSFEMLCSQRNDFPQDLVTIQSKFRSNRYGYIWFLLAGLLLVGAVVASWFFWSGNQQETPQVQQGLVPDYLRAAENGQQEIVLSIPVANQIYTVHSPNHLSEKSSGEEAANSSVPRQRTGNDENPMSIQPEQPEEGEQQVSSPSVTGRLEG